MLTAFTRRHFDMPAVWKNPDIISTFQEMRCRLHRLLYVQRYTYQPAMTGFETIKLDSQNGAITIAGNASSDLATIEVLNGLAAVATMTFAEI